MTKLSYELVAIEADKLIVRMVLSSNYDSHYYYQMYLSYLEACGWNEISYDRETLKRIDAAWDSYLKPKFWWN